MAIAIQSISDIITNSSTEVYLQIHKNEFENLKDLLRDLISNLLPEGGDFDAMFSLDFEYSDYMFNIFKERYKEEIEGMDETDAIWYINEEQLSIAHVPLITGISVTANNKWNEQIAQDLEVLINGFFEPLPLYE